MNQPHTNDIESKNVWGFADSGFVFNDAGELTFKGSRYRLAGQILPYLLPWIEKIMQVKIDTKEVHVDTYPPAITAPINNEAFIKSVSDFLAQEQMSIDGEIRLRHGHGHTQYEMYAIKYDKLARIPDLVVYPANENEVEQIVSEAFKHNVCLIPYGGGTNVTEALLCPTNETRMIVSVDLSRMNQILWVDTENRLACIQAGAVGRHISEQLKRRGFTLGHEPDSIEFSTMGGWIATHASGMKKNKYGNIEDIVLDFNVVTSLGKLTRSLSLPRESVGIDPRQIFFGSEGNFGIITQAIVKLQPYPESQRYGSILFPNFEQGVAFFYELAKSGKLPASIRLVDNLQFQFSQSLKPASVGLKKIISTMQKYFVTKIKKFDPEQMVAATVVFEGIKEDVIVQEKQLYRLAKKFGGMASGEENGRKGYELTFSIAYIRDFVMNHYVLAESFETSVPWSKAVDLCNRVKQRLYDECSKHGIPGKPFVTCRVTQIYDTGVCVYFYFAFYYKGVANPTAVYHEIENAAREEILACGGALSHHHGVGKIRTQFLQNIKSAPMLDMIKKIKETIDPKNIFGAANQQL